MNSITLRLLFYISTALISLFYLMGAYMYISCHENIIDSFSTLKFPLWLIIPLGVAKFLGVLALWLPKIPNLLREWAYAGIFFNALLAFGANLAVNNYDIAAVLIMLLLLIARFLLFKFESETRNH